MTEIELNGENYGIDADFSQASAQIMTIDGDGEWISTQYQVADFQHDERKAAIAIIGEQYGDNSEVRSALS